MSARNIYKVKFLEGKWQIVKDGKILGYYKSKKNAIAKAILSARKKVSSQVVVFRMHGSVEETLFNY